LFICYINDMPETVQSLIYLYADDSKLCREVSSETDVSVLQQDLYKLQEWSTKWQLTFNTGKCKVMHMGKHNLRNDYIMLDGTVLEKTDVEKDLGVWVDKSLTFKDHVTHAINKANQILGLIRRSFIYIDEQSMKQLYTALVRPHLEYGNVVWYPRFKTDVEAIERVQHRATRMVPGLAKLPYEERLKKMKLPSLVYRRIRGDAIETYKYLHNIYSVNSAVLLPPLMTEVNTRGHNMRLQKRYCKTDTRANFFGYRTVNLWNCLPYEVVNSVSLGRFKGSFDKYFGDNCYKTSSEDVLSSAVRFDQVHKDTFRAVHRL
jgi:ribonuclease P/MRP protein subunit RPP40